MKNHVSLKEYLIKLNLLGSTDAEAIANAKKAYRKEYMRLYKQKRRMKIKEVVLSFNSKKYGRIKHLAFGHGQTTTSFIYHILDSYMDGVPVTQHPQYFSELQRTIAKIHSEISFMADMVLDKKTKVGITEMELQIQELEQRIEDVSRPKDLQRYIQDILNNDGTGRSIDIIRKVMKENP